MTLDVVWQLPVHYLFLVSMWKFPSCEITQFFWNQRFLLFSFGNDHSTFCEKRCEQLQAERKKGIRRRRRNLPAFFVSHRIACRFWWGLFPSSHWQSISASSDQSYWKAFVNCLDTEYLVAFLFVYRISQLTKFSHEAPLQLWSELYSVFSYKRNIQWWSQFATNLSSCSPSCTTTPNLLIKQQTSTHRQLIHFLSAIHTIFFWGKKKPWGQKDWRIQICTIYN